jgi:hypothetical protein
MDFESYWQENKNFVLSVAGGALGFLILFLVLDSSYGADVRSGRARVSRERAKLAQSFFTQTDLSRAQAENDDLVGSSAKLAENAVFTARPAFLLEAGNGSPSNQYFGRVDRVQRELNLVAGRARCVLPEGLGLEPLKTNDEQVIARHLEALDLLDRALHRAIDAGVDRVARVEVALDPGLNSRSGLGRIERTRLTLRLVADPPAIADFMLRTQSSKLGPLLVDRYDARASPGRVDEVTLDLVLLAVRLHETVTGDED